MAELLFNPNNSKTEFFLVLDKILPLHFAFKEIHVRLAGHQTNQNFMCLSGSYLLYCIRFKFRKFINLPLLVYENEKTGFFCFHHAESAFISWEEIMLSVSARQMEAQ